MLNPLTVRKILKKGTPGQATVQSMTTPARGAAKYNLGMTLHVFVEGMTPYEVQDQWIVSAKTPIGFGMTLPVKVDRKDPTQVAVDWDAHEANQEQAAEQRRAGLAAMGPVGAGDPADPGPTVIDTRGDPDLRNQILGALGVDPTPTNPVDPPDDPIARLERLTALRDAGALTEEEFQRLKGDILGG
jgi:hypothetical protein